MKVRKIKEDWFPSENRGVKVGEVIDFPADPSQLIAEGKVELAEEPAPVMSQSAEKRVEAMLKIKEEETKPVEPSFQPDVSVEHSKVEEAMFQEALKEPVVTESVPTVEKKPRNPFPGGKTKFSDLTEEEKRAWRVENLRIARENKKEKEDVED